MRASGFWGLVVEPSRMYSQVVPATFKITMASLGPEEEVVSSSVKPVRTTLIMKLDEKEDFAICSLTTGKIEQQPIDLVFVEGENISFRTEGTQNIHLTGYYLNDEAEDGFINDDDEDSEVDDDEIYSDEAEVDSQIEYDSDEDYSESEEDSEAESKSNKNPRIRVIESEEEEEEDEEDMNSEDEELDSEEEEEEMESEEDAEVAVEAVKPSKRPSVTFDLPEAKKTKDATEKSPAASPSKKVSPPPAQPAKVATPAAAPVAKAVAATPAQQDGKSPVKKTLPSGLQIEDIKLGNGAKASQGKKVLIHYKGTLLNGSVFDSSFGGKPLKFAVGKGDVIKGMDIGIVGMAVGGTRKLVIPGPLAYGNQALPKIPRNSTLVFEIRLEKIL